MDNFFSELLSSYIYVETETNDKTRPFFGAQRSKGTENVIQIVLQAACDLWYACCCAIIIFTKFNDLYHTPT